MSNERNKVLIDKAQAHLLEFKRFQKLGLIPVHGDFFASGVHYPPITMYEPKTFQDMYETYTLPEDGMMDIYVHIPFCIRRCLFCHYPSLYRANDSKKDEYLDALEKEMGIFLKMMDIEKINARTILMGGGTPTDLTPAQLKRFLTFFTKFVNLDKCKQYNWDVDPSTLVGTDGIERLKIIKDFGGDRLTVGIQSLDDGILKKMNRSHDSSVAIESIRNCQKLDFKLNVELIFGHPGQTFDNWIEVLDKTVALGTPEIQFYRLKVEPYGDQEGSIKKYRDYHADELPPADDAILMKQIAIEVMEENGYKENLRRVFTKKRSDISLYAFNQCCQLLDEIGFGLTAFSSLRDRFVLNTQYFEDYYKKISEGVLPLNRGIIRSKEEQIRWSTILPLKNYFIRKKRFEEINGFPISQVFQEKIDQLKQYDLVEETDSRIELTKKGAFFADEIVEQFHSDKYIAFPKSDYNKGPLNPYDNQINLNL